MGNHQLSEAEFEAQEREWAAWRQICLQLEQCGVIANDNAALCAAMRLWGEELHALRDLVGAGGQKRVQEVLGEARAEYRQHWIVTTET